MRIPILFSLIALLASACGTTAHQAQLRAMHDRGKVGLIVVPKRVDFPTSANPWQSMYDIFGPRPWRGDQIISVSHAIRSSFFPFPMGVDFKRVAERVLARTYEETVGQKVVTGAANEPGLAPFARDTYFENRAVGQTLVTLNDTRFSEEIDWSGLAKAGYSGVVLCTLDTVAIIRQPSQFFGRMTLYIIDLKSDDPIHIASVRLWEEVDPYVFAPFFPDISLQNSRANILQYNLRVSRRKQDRAALSEEWGRVVEAWAEEALATIDP